LELWDMACVAPEHLEDVLIFNVELMWILFLTQVFSLLFPLKFNLFHLFSGYMWRVLVWQSFCWNTEMKGIKRIMGKIYGFWVGYQKIGVLISYVALETLPNLFVPWVSFLRNEEDSAFLTVYLVGILAEKMILCSVYEVLKGEMLVECKVCLHCLKSYYLF
jgi:hypothetical protein